jgi:tetratricopeptide (TPR) repeat protein
MVVEMFTEKLPFDGRNAKGITAAVLRGERPALGQGIPQQLVDVIQRAWSGDPSKRPTFHVICVELAHGRSVRQDVAAPAPAAAPGAPASVTSETNAEAWMQRGNDLLGKNDVDGADDAYRQALAINAEDADAWYNLGNLLDYKRGNVDGAEEAYREVLVINPEYANAWYNLGNLLQNKRGNVDGAEEAYRKVLAINPEYADAWYNLGNLLQNKRGDVDGAEEAYRKVLAINPEDADARVKLDILLENKRGKVDGAGKKKGRRKKKSSPVQQQYQQQQPEQDERTQPSAPQQQQQPPRQVCTHTTLRSPPECVRSHRVVARILFPGS